MDHRKRRPDSCIHDARSILAVCRRQYFDGFYSTKRVSEEEMEGPMEEKLKSVDEHVDYALCKWRARDPCIG